MSQSEPRSSGSAELRRHTLTDRLDRFQWSIQDRALEDDGLLKTDPKGFARESADLLFAHFLVWSGGPDVTDVDLSA